MSVASESSHLEQKTEMWTWPKTVQVLGMTAVVKIEQWVQIWWCFTNQSFVNEQKPKYLSMRMTKGIYTAVVGVGGRSGNKSNGDMMNDVQFMEEGL